MGSKALVVLLVVALAGGAVWYFTRERETREERAKKLWDEATESKEEGRYNQAVKAAKAYLDTAPDPNPRAYGIMAFCYGRLGDYEAAITNWTKLLELQPDDANARVLLAMCILDATPDKGQAWEKATQELRKLTQDDLRRRGVAYNVACLCAKNGRAETALQYLKLGIEVDPSYKESAKTDKDFDSIRHLPQFQQLIR
jgi:tetratricopeptide (TPR) repeat protein